VEKEVQRERGTGEKLVEKGITKTEASGFFEGIGSKKEI